MKPDSNGTPTDLSVEDRLDAILDAEDGDIPGDTAETPKGNAAPPPTSDEPDDEDDSRTPVGTDAHEPVSDDDGDGSEPPTGEQDDGNENAPAFAVKIAGKEEKVPLPELLAGYSRTRDYTQKTQALAEERRAFVAEQEAVRQERALYAQTLHRLQQKAEADLAQEPDWDTLRETNPIEYGIQYAEWSRKREKLAAFNAEQQRLQAEAQRERAIKLTQHVESEREKLYAAMPGWTDPERAKREGEAIRAYGKSVGWTDEDLDQAYDHRAVLVLDKARRWDELQARKGKALPNPRSSAPRTTSAGPAPQRTPQQRSRKQFDERRAALRKSGHVDDAARALELILDD